MCRKSSLVQSRRRRIPTKRPAGKGCRLGHGSDKMAAGYRYHQLEDRDGQLDSGRTQNPVWLSLVSLRGRQKSNDPPEEWGKEGHQRTSKDDGEM